MSFLVAVVHSWKAFYTCSTGLSEFPGFVALNTINDEIMGSCSKTNNFENHPRWMAGTLGQEYYNRQAKTLRGHKDAFKQSVRVAMVHFNQSEGVHTFQRMVGCQWDDESGATDASDGYGYDGEDFILLDIENLRWIAAVPQSVVTKNKWDTERAELEYLRNYFTRNCTDWLKKYVQYRRSTIMRTGTAHNTESSCCPAKSGALDNPFAALTVSERMFGQFAVVAGKSEAVIPRSRLSWVAVREVSGRLLQIKGTHR
ncbi:major histocompatibility complex class I-related gene protein-like [Alosa sapidissima]|uniref:major histocompatibility complex class I-related gene protein-like n=1 Tax=Alosa sapidissima TaxID=34773 RepID=UPI001C0A4CF0|nr:major histocompatibility complex class I-related gene protein-like [Alosa sapidissima]